MSFLSDIGNFVSNAVSTVADIDMQAAQMAFPQVALLNAGANLLMGAMGGGIQDALKQLTQCCGMPNFIAKEIGDIVGKVIGGLLKPHDGACQDHVQSHLGGPLADFNKAFCDGIVQSVEDQIKSKCGDGKGAKATSWFEALANALGEALNKQSKQVEDLAKVVEGLDPKSDDRPKALTDLQAASQKMSFMMSSADQVIKTLGEALSTAARKG